jgi:cytoskeletal protein CcmA (bactofilin family)
VVTWGVFDRRQSEAGEWSGFLDRGVRLEGKLEAPGTFRIDSRIKGTLVSEGTLILGEHATVEGEVKGNSVIIAGRFDGIIQARGRVEIQTKAIVTAQIHTPCLIIEPGAVVEGSCHVLGATDPSRPITIPLRSVVAQA